MNKYKVKISRVVVEELIIEAESASSISSMVNESTRILSINVTREK